MPLFYDQFWIQHSSRAIFIVLLLLFSTNLLFGIIAIYIDDRHHVMLSLIESHIICASNLSIIVITTFVVFYKNRSNLAPEHNLSAFLSTRGRSVGRLTLTTNASSIFKRQSSMEAGSSKKQIHSRIVLKSVLKDPMWFDQFMAHLATEFSTECLLAIIEFNQLQEHCIEHFHDYLSSRYDYKRRLLELPPDIPQSLIVYGSSREKVTECDLAITLESVANKSMEPLTGSTLNVLNSHKHYETASGDITPSDDVAVKHSPNLRRTKSNGLYADLKPLRNRMRLLYQKYIESRAEFQINIRYDMRNEFAHMVDNEELWAAVDSRSGKNRNKLHSEKIISEKLHQILTLLAKVVDEMLKLLSHSFARFRQTSVFDNMKT